MVRKTVDARVSSYSNPACCWGPRTHSSQKLNSMVGGRFSHWENTLRFSSSDNSSPLTNGRDYVVLAPSALSKLFSAARHQVTARIRATIHRLSSLALPPAGVQDTLFFFYDLTESPISFDIASQLVIAELERRQRLLKSVHMVFVPGEWRHRHYLDFAHAAPPEALRLRLYQLALPISGLLETCRGVTVCASREEAEWLCFTLARHVYPQDYEPAASDQRTVKLARARAPEVPADQFFPMFRANDEARRAVAAFLADQVGDATADCRYPSSIGIRR